MRSRLVVASLLGALALAGPALAEEEAASVEQVVVERAQTPADHLALAAHYRAKAEEAREAARRHQAMGSAYLRGKSGRPYQNHCRKLSEQQEASAREYDALAALHEAEARQDAEP
jgi:hypothetical protein